MATGNQKRRPYGVEDPSDPQTLRSAWHAAGHAIAHFRTAQRFQSVTLVPHTRAGDEPCGGVLPPLSSRSLHATLRRILSDDEQETMDNARGLLERRVIASLAGAEAEALYTGIHPLTQLPPDTDDASAWDMWQAVWEMYTQAAAPKMSTLSSPDLRHACALIAPGTKSDDEAIAYLRYLQLRARNLVRRHRDEVEALAVPLTVCGEFTYRQAYHLVYKLAAYWEELRTLRALMALGMVVPGEQAA